MLTAFRYFIHPNKLPWTRRRAKTRFEQKWYNKLCTGKEYPMNEETGQTEIQAHILKNSSITVHRFPVYVIASQLRKPHTMADRAKSHWFLKQSVFVETNRNDVTLLLSWIYYKLTTVLDEVLQGFSKRSSHYALCMTDTRVQCIICANDLRINICCVSLNVDFFVLNYKHSTTMFSSCI